jgi:diguanylate cyclase
MTSKARLDPDARGGIAEYEADQRVARRSQVATAAIVLILVAATVFAVWSSHDTSNAAEKAVAASGVSDAYARADSAISEQESLERKYRLEPGPAVRARYNQAAAALVTALADVHQDGNPGDQALADRVLAQQRTYLAATTRLFAAVDRGDAAEVLRIDTDEADPSFGAMEQAVLEAATDKHQIALIQLAHLLWLEDLTRQVTPLVFVAGLLLVGALASTSRGHRRSLHKERGRAVRDSLHDALTGLPNRTLLADRLEHALVVADRAGTSLGLLLIDLDRFKEINDTFGHHYGDELLAQIGPRLTGALRDVDTVARLGGDEFAVLLPDLRSVDDAVAVAAKLRIALRAPFRVEGVDFDVEASVGVVLSGVHGQDANTLLRRVDIAMYVAKTQDLGVFAYNPVLDEHSPAKLALVGDLRRGIDRGELVLHYQPKVLICSGDVVGAEALVRWKHPQRGLVFPDAFIPLAEHTGLMGPLTRYVLDAALAQARVWMDADRALTVSVNLSARNLLDDGLPVQVAELLAAHGVVADLLELEVTESAIMTEPVRAQRILEQLSALGVKISIDDFGVGYTSLGQLKTLPVTELKIDRSFVMTMTEDQSNALIVHSVVDLGHKLGLTIVAEGVESGDALAALAALDCDIAQGYHLSPPLPVEAFDAWYVSRVAAADRY